jgi:flagellar hook protein FlgE
MVSTMVALSQSAIDARSAANVIKTGDEMLGTMINLRA